MKKIFALLIALSPIFASADPFDVVEKSLSCRYYNQAVYLEWLRPGGTWSGMPENGNAFVTTSTSATAPALLSWQLPAALDPSVGLVVRRTRGTGIVYLYSREAVDQSVRPYLLVTYQDGSNERIFPRADIWIASPNASGACTSFLPMPNDATLRANYAAILQFPKLRPDVAAMMLFATASYRSGSADVGIFQLRPPIRPEAEVTTGLAKDYPGDIGIDSHPSVLYSETWDINPRDWYLRAGEFPPGAPLDQNWRHDNGFFPNWWPYTFFAPGQGYIGDGLRVHFDPRIQTSTYAPTYDHYKKTGEELEEAYGRVMFKFNNMKGGACQGGKLPGFAGHYYACANSGTRPDGYCGWSMRQHFIQVCDPDNPFNEQLELGVYAYHPDQVGLFGDHYSAANLGLHGIVKNDEWHCLEQRVKVNTPGVRDGIVQVWVDGKLALDKRDIMMRKALDETHPAYPNGPNNGIQIFWGSIYYGGRTPLGHDADVWIDNTVVATQRIGCVEPLIVPPPPVEICGDGIDNNGDGQIDEGCPPPPPPAEVCGDEIDNNGDGRVDEDCPPSIQAQLEKALEDLAKARADIEIAQLQISTLEGALALKSEQLVQTQIDVGIAQALKEQALSDLAISEGRLAAAQATITKIREVLQ